MSIVGLLFDWVPGLARGIAGVRVALRLWSIHQGRELSDAQRARTANAMRIEIERELAARSHARLREEVILRDIRRPSEYLKAEGAGRSWGRYGLCGIYHDGLEVGLGHEALTFHTEHTYRVRREGEAIAITAAIIGRIPFDRIVAVVWSGDTHYGFPIMSCDYGPRGDPFVEVLACREVPRRGHGYIYDPIEEWGRIQARGEGH